MQQFDFGTILDGVLPILGGIISSILVVISYVWWIALPVILFYIYIEHRLKVLQLNYIKNIKWVMLELRIPKENLKSPKSMEQVFSSLHAMHSFGIKGHDKHFKGKVESWMSFEMIGHNGGVHFYIKTPADLRNLVESSIMAQYPDAELSEVDDYVDQFPSVLPSKHWDLWGVDIILSKDEPYPIKTWEYFEEKDKEKRLDPLSSIMEVMSKLKDDEQIFLQFLIKGTSGAVSDYGKKGQEVIDKMLGKEPKAVAKKIGIHHHAHQWGKNFILAPIKPPEWGFGEAKKDEKPPKIVGSLPKSEKDVIEGIENKMTKICYDVIIRLVLIGKAGALNRSYISPVMGTFKQYNIENMNSFKPNGDTITSKNTWFANFFPSYKKQFEYLRKRSLWDRYRFRMMVPKSSVMSVEELATIYHVPTNYVGAPRMHRIEAKKSEPPVNLPIEA